ncbi:UBX domain-containing protein 8-like isoform X2 [Apostichopus japonicus]|uniref:UBX domain-containing protein 8-like isoform X2 n=1 Tax=Stichopus japonicus TaxID=307972 RepID=UPI003AB20ADF
MCEDATTLVHSSLVALFYVITLIILWTLFGNKLKQLWKQFYKDPEPTKTRILPNEVHKELQEASRRKIDLEHKTKATDYEERILRPREEARKKELEEDFRRFTGPAWKGKAQPLGNTEDDGDNNTRKGLRKRAEGTSRDAANIRKIPENSRKKVTTPEAKPQPIKIITLPEEPPEGSHESVTIALRGLSDVKKRRFLKTEKVQVLLDWMTKQGYHPKLYTLYTTYPRQDLSKVTEQSLKEAGMTHDIVVLAEEREDVR